jgi:multiple sugar transport system substrate-binding protein
MRYLINILLATSLLAGIRAQAATEINYWLWDNNQLPSYQACAEAFEKENPKGPLGRKSVINGLADSIWIGSKHQEEAWKWVKFLASPEAQKIVGGYGVVFPAIAEAAEISMKRMAAKGADVSAFVEEAKQPDGTFFLPISEHASDVVRILRANFDAIFLEGADVTGTLKATNKEVNALFE